MVERGEILYVENRKLFSTKNRLLISFSFFLLILIGILFYYSIKSEDIACFAPTIFLTLFMIGLFAIVYSRMNMKFTIYENGIQFSDYVVGYVNFTEIIDIKFGMKKSNLAKYLLIKRKGVRNITIAGNDFGYPWEITDDFDNVREIIEKQWNKINNGELN